VNRTEWLLRNVEARALEPVAAFWVGPGSQNAAVRLGAFLGEPEAGAKLVEGLSPAAQALLAMLVEVPRVANAAIFEGEATRLVGAAWADATNEIARRHLLFESRHPWDPEAPHEMFVLQPFREALQDELGGLLAATEPFDRPPDGPEEASAADPTFEIVVTLSAIETLQPRLTGDRLYKKAAEKMAALLGSSIADAEDARRRLTALGLSNRAGERARISWQAAEAFAELSPMARTRRALLARWNSFEWRTIVAAAGAWVPEERFARPWRLQFRTRGANPWKTADAQWRGIRERLSWTEAETRELGGHRHHRLRPGWAASLRAQAGGGRIYAQANFEVIAPRDAPLADLLLLARICELRRADAAATYAITADSVRRAARAGLTPDRVLPRLAAASASGVPDNVARAVRDWAGEVGHVTIERALLLRFDDERIAARARAELGEMVRSVAPAVLAADLEHEGAVRAALSRSGLGPREGEEGDGAFPASYLEPETPLGLSIPPARLDAVRAARIAEARAGVPPGGRTRARLPKLRSGLLVQDDPAACAEADPLVVALLDRAVQLRADVVLQDADGTPWRIRAETLAAEEDGWTFCGMDTDTQDQVELDAADVVHAEILLGTARTPGRNDPCPCGGGSKFKHCCLGRLDARQSAGG